MRANRDGERKTYQKDWTQEELEELRARQRPSPGKVSGTMRLAASAPAVVAYREDDSNGHDRAHDRAGGGTGAHTTGGARGGASPLWQTPIMDEFGGILRCDERVQTLPANASHAHAPVQCKQSDDLPSEGDSGVSASGEALPDAVREKMESALGMDFSGVRVHVGPEPQRVGALAFTRGTDVFFAPGQYQPESQRGQELLGHELAHVKQQANGRVRATQDLGGLAVNDDAGLEREADEMGTLAARGQAGGRLPLPGPVVEHGGMGHTAQLKSAPSNADSDESASAAADPGADAETRDESGSTEPLVEEVEEEAEMDNDDNDAQASDDPELQNALIGALKVTPEDAQQLMDSPQAMAEMASWQERPPLDPPERLNAATILGGAVEYNDPKKALGDKLARARAGELPFRKELEAMFGQSLADIKVLMGEDDYLEQLGARGVTIDGVVILPSSPSKELVAHEVTHALQKQKHGSREGTGVSKPGDASEVEADGAVEAVKAGRPMAVQQRTAAQMAPWAGVIRFIVKILKQLLKRGPRKVPRPRPRPKTPSAKPKPKPKQPRKKKKKNKDNTEAEIRRVRQEIRAKLKNPFLRRGPNARPGGSIATQNHRIASVTKGERDQINQFGNLYGDHHTSVKSPGTTSGAWIPDHMPVTELVLESQRNAELRTMMTRARMPTTLARQRLYPHSLGSSKIQGGVITAIKLKLGKLQRLKLKRK